MGCVLEDHDSIGTACSGSFVGISATWRARANVLELNLVDKGDGVCRHHYNYVRNHSDRKHKQYNRERHGDDLATSLFDLQTPEKLVLT